MAQLNITLNQDEVLQVLGDDTGDAFRLLLQEALNGVLQAESAEQLQACRYERTDRRKDSRNGTRKRPLVTRIGKVELEVPRHRNAPFRTMVFENYQRSEGALVTTMAEMVVGGVSTARVGRVMETLCGQSFSRQSVSEACAGFDAIVEEFCSRRLEKRYPFVMVDATGLKAREGHRVVPKKLMIAIGFDEDGRKEVLGFSVCDEETRETWAGFLSALRMRGLDGVRMFTSDAHEGIIAALRGVYPDVAWQRCQAHFSRNVVDGAPEGYKKGLKAELTEMFNCPDARSARALRDRIYADYLEVAPKAVERLDAGFDDAMTVMELPGPMRRYVRTTNYIERLNREVKRRSDVIGVFPNAESIMRLAGTRLIEENDNWSQMKRVYFKTTFEEFKKKEGALLEIARRQTRLWAAA